jgi:hypothetical protein
MCFMNELSIAEQRIGLIYGTYEGHDSMTCNELI